MSTKTKNQMIDELFKDIVGQSSAKKKLNFYVDSYHTTRLVPNLLLVAPKGCGKTTLSRALAKGLVKFDENGKVEMKPDGVTPVRKTFIEINCSTLKNVKQFINGVVIPFINDKDVTVLFDEASELPKDITMALLTILNPNPENRTTFSHEEYVCDFDFRRQTFLFATAEIQKVNHMLVDRLKRIDLEEYSYGELAQIVQRGCKDIEFRDDVMKDVASVLRGNARNAQMMASDILTFLKNRSIFTRKDWNGFCEIFGIMPLDLSPIELSVLRYLSETIEGTSLTALSAKTGMSRDALQKDIEMYLQKHGLMGISTTGRVITAKGLEYVRAIDKQLGQAEVKKPVKAVKSNDRPKVSAPVINK